MLAVGFFIWWYTEGWAQTTNDFRRRFTNSLNIFSVPVLLRTLFSPWRRIIASAEAGLSEKLKAASDNLLSRCIGFTVRLLVLIAAAILLFFVSLFNALIVVIWPFLPPLVLVLLIKAVA